MTMTDDFDLGRALVDVICGEHLADACDPLFAEVLGRNMRAPLQEAATIVCDLVETIEALNQRQRAAER